MPLKKTRGKKHNYLGMFLDFSIPGMFEIALKEYIRQIMSEAQVDMIGTAHMPAGNYLFSVNTTSATYLNESDAQHCHYYKRIEA